MCHDRKSTNLHHITTDSAQDTYTHDEEYVVSCRWSAGHAETYFIFGPDNCIRISSLLSIQEDRAPVWCLNIDAGCSCAVLSIHR